MIINAKMAGKGYNLHHIGVVAQLVERSVRNAEVRGSTPLGSTIAANVKVIIMPMENYSESDTRAKLITPALWRRGWTEDMIRREETLGAIMADEQGAYRSDKKRTDYVLRVIAKDGAQPVAVALIEAKRSDNSPGAGMEQVKRYAKLQNVPFAFSSNGYQFVGYDETTGKTTAAENIAHFPKPEELRRRYEEYIGCSLGDECAKALITKYAAGEGARRYYQDAAIRAALEKIAAKEKANESPRVLLSLATGAGKTFIATQLLKRLNDSGKMRRALFLCDRDALRKQALGAFRDVFGNDTEEAKHGSDGGNIAENARIHIATYQTLGISGEEEDDKSFAEEHYPQNHFSHIIIDECHRSAWNKWSAILHRNPKAVQIGLTATPRNIKNDEGEDKQISANNHKHFGEPVYAYSLPQGAADGYLALCHIRKANINLDNTGVSMEELMKHKPVNYLTGEPLTEEQLKRVYEDRHFEGKLVLPDRIDMMCEHLFGMLSFHGGSPRQKTIIFCVSDIHAQLVAAKMNNLYATWRKQNNEEESDPYAFCCTAASDGNKALPDFRGEGRHHFVATTVDLLSTGVDIPRLRNVAFFKYVNSPISLHQMIGRGARTDIKTDKLDFAVYDYTDATRLLGKDEWQAPKGGDSKRRNKPQQTTIPTATGFAVSIADTGEYVWVEEEDGTQLRLSAEEYRKRLAQRLLQKIKTADGLRSAWVIPQERSALLKFLADDKCAPEVLRALSDMKQYDDYDILASAAYGVLPQTRKERAEIFGDKNAEWLKFFPQESAQTLLALASLFARGGIGELENRAAFDTESVRKAGGLAALQNTPGKKPAELITETKRRLFAA